MNTQTKSSTQLLTLGDPTTAPADPLSDHPTATMDGGVPWSARIMAATGRSDLAAENLEFLRFATGDFTQALTELLNDNPQMSLDEAMDILDDRNVSETKGGEQYPSQARMGKGQSQQAQRKFALIIANSDYLQDPEDDNPRYGDLKAYGDGAAMAGSLSSRGFDTKTFGIHADLDAAALRKVIVSAAQSESLGEGDLLVIHFSGHGESQGLVGVDGKVFPNSVLANLPNVAQARGYQLRILLDSCFSGSAVGDALAQRAILEKRATKDADRKKLFDNLRELRNYASFGLESACMQATREYYIDQAAQYGAKEHAESKLLPDREGKLGDANRPNVMKAMRTHGLPVSAYWESEGWQKVYWLLEPFDQALGKIYQIPNHDQYITFDELQDAIDDVLAEIVEDMGIESDDYIKAALAPK